MGRQDHGSELAAAVRRENWSLYGPNRIVKVLPAYFLQGPCRPGEQMVNCVSGYIGLAKFISGKDPLEIEIALGLRKHSMLNGAAIFSPLRLPSPTEYRYELTADTREDFERPI